MAKDMTSVAIIYNYGEVLGGGDLVMLNILRVLVENNYNVTLITSYPEGLAKSQSFFDIKIDRTKIDVKNINISRRIPHPYNIAIITRKAIRFGEKHDLYIVSDDIPKSLAKLASRNEAKVIVYSHYPHASRILLKELVPFRFRYSFKGRILWRIHSILFKYYYSLDWNNENIYVLSNSTLTYEHINKSLNPANNIILYPPVQVRKLLDKLPNKEKTDKIIYIGRIQPEKGVEDLLEALKILKEKNGNTIKATIIGFKLSDKYLKRILDIVEKYSLDNVTIHINAPRSIVLKELSESKIIVHPAIHEAFGIAVVEGLAAGCTPIVRCGMYGPWRDILENGKYGYCFRNVTELASQIIRAIRNPLNRDTALKKALEFDEESFTSKLIEIIQDII